MDSAPQVKIVVPKKGNFGKGTKVFINGIEFTSIADVKFSGLVDAGSPRTSKIELTFYGDILVEQGA